MQNEIPKMVQQRASENEFIALETFPERIDCYAAQTIQLKKQFNRVSTMRLLAFGAGFLFGIYGVFKMNALSCIIAVLCTVLFIRLIYRHNRIDYQLKYCGAMIEVLDRHRKRSTDEWRDFQETGQAFIDDGHAYASDLDLFGPNSLYQYINIVNTHMGELSLSNLFRTADQSPAQIPDRQQAVGELRDRFGFCIELELFGSLFRRSGSGVPEKSSPPDSFLSFAEDQSLPFKNPPFIKALSYILPLATILSWILWLLNHRFPIIIPELLLIVQLLFVWFSHPRLTGILVPSFWMKDRIDQYQSLITHIEKHEFHAPMLSTLRDGLFHDGLCASTQLSALGRVINAIDVRGTPIVHFILNSALLWDYHCMFALHRWKLNSGNQLRRWLDTIAGFETYASIAVPAFLNPKWAFPTFCADPLEIEATNISHPLIDPDKRVANDFSSAQSITIITGSNMSGKTTFLRTIGINTVLAYMGSVVCAEHFLCPIATVFTSMRVRDDTAEGISSFYAELLRIKRIVEAATTEPPILFFLDELLKGTNSGDRISGAKAIVNRLCSDHAMGFISTHDFELCALEDGSDDQNSESGSVVSNYHFIEHYVDDRLHFDYKLHPGRCTSTNARQLMKMMGI